MINTKKEEIKNMGMDYNYAGSASYLRFDRELCAVAEVFGGIKTELLKQHEETEGDRFLGYWFGFLSSDGSNEPKFVFPKKTDKLLVKWFNNIYCDFSVEETKAIWEYISKHPEIKEISSQIWEELESCVEDNAGWFIC